MQPIPAQRSAQVYEDSSEQEAGLRGWAQHYAQSEPGAYHGSIERLDLPGLSISRETVGRAVEQTTTPPEDRVIFCQTLVQRGPWRFNAQSCEAGLTGFIRGGETHLAMLPSGAEILMVEADRSLMARELGQSAARLVIDGAFVALPETAELRAFAEWSMMVLAAPGAMSALMPDLLKYNLGRMWERLRLDSRVLGGLGPRGDYRLFRRAEELIRDGGLEVPSVSALAGELRQPVPVLRRAFLNSVGIGPVEWLRRHRLDGARRALLHAGAETSVTDVAMTWGFLHLGRFSAVYAAQFGETPSATLRRARPQAGGARSGLAEGAEET